MKVWLGAVWVALAVTAAVAQDTTPTLRVTARIVLLDTNVVDAKGKPVTGLTAQDFAIYEDKRQERIVSFEAPEAHALPAGSGVTTVFDPGKPTAFGSSAVTMIVLDEVNTHFSDSAYAIHAVEDYLAKQGDVLSQPSTLVVVKDSRFQQLVPFTLDKQRVLKALHTFMPEQAWALEQSMSAGNGVAERLDHSLAALEQLAQYGARIPGRKNLIWVGAGFPTIDPEALTEGTHRMLGNMLQHATDVLLDSRVTLFAIDPTTTAAGLLEITDPVQLQVAAAGVIEGASNTILAPFDRSYDFDRLGPVTGGRSVRGLNDVDRLVGEAIASGGNYYTIGYRPSNGSDVAGQFRHIKVVCLRPGLVATTHDGYYTSSPKATLATDTIGYDLNNAATATIPFHAVQFTADSGEAGSFTLHVQARDLTWVTAGDQQQAQVQVLAVALSPKGKILTHKLLSETASAAQDVDTRAVGQLARFTVTLPAPAGAGTLRLVVRDTASGRMGTLDKPEK